MIGCTWKQGSGKYKIFPHTVPKGETRCIWCGEEVIDVDQGRTDQGGRGAEGG